MRIILNGKEIKNVEVLKFENDEKRFRESSERKTLELFFPSEDLSKLHKREFLAEAHQRLISLIVIFAMILLGAITFLIGEFDRKMSFKKLAFSISTAVLLQLYLVATNPLIIKSIEWLYLAAKGHRRAHLTFEKNNLKKNG